MLPFVALQVPNANTPASLYHFYTTFYPFKCLSQFDQVEYCNVDSDNLDRYCFYPVLEFVVSEFLSNKALLLPDLYKKFAPDFEACNQTLLSPSS
jgi:hypothetical protein